MKRKRWIDIIIIGVMICCVTVVVQIYFNTIYRECINEPLVYASKFYEEKYGYPFQGSGSFVRGGQSPIIYFDSYGVSVENP